MAAIEGCRTEVLGGHIYTCATCATTRYCYHSCRNRHCPTCQQDATQTWLAQQHHLLLPVPYFLVTFTLPAQLRAVARQHQRRIYALFFHTSAAALQQLAQDWRFLGGQIGMLGVLQTWTRDLRYHPHIHYLVPAVGLSADGRWVVGNRRFLVHMKPLALLFRAKFRAALRQTSLDADVLGQAWHQPWVVDCRAVGSGYTALRYLAPYIFRVALSNNRIVHVANEQVTFRYQDGKTRHQRLCTLSAGEFIHRFLQHVLPKGFVKIRYYGLFSPGKRRLLAHLRQVLALTTGTVAHDASSPAPSAQTPRMHPSVCPSCGQPRQVMHLLPRRSRAPPLLAAPTRVGLSQG
jgi:hypothetical protein